jgi:hypothetical protein
MARRLYYQDSYGRVHPPALPGAAGAFPPPRLPSS